MLESNQNKKAQLCLSTAPTVTCSSLAPSFSLQAGLSLQELWKHFPQTTLKGKLGKFLSKKHLVGGFNPSEKYQSNWMISPSRVEHEKYLKPPPRTFIDLLFHKICRLQYFFGGSHSLNQSFPIFLFLWVLAKFRYQLITCIYIYLYTLDIQVYTPKN